MRVELRPCDEGQAQSAQWRAALGLAVLMLAELAEQVDPPIIDSATIQTIARDILDATERGELFVRNHAQAMKAIEVVSEEPSP